MSSRPVTRSQVSASATLTAVMITRSRSNARARSSTTAKLAVSSRPAKRTRTTIASSSSSTTRSAPAPATATGTTKGKGAGKGKGKGAEKKKEPIRVDDAKESAHVHELEDGDGAAAMSGNMKTSNNKKSSKMTKKKKSSSNNNNNNNNNNTSKKTLIKTELTSHQQTNSVEEKKQISDLASLHGVSLPVSGSSLSALISAVASHGGATSMIVDHLLSILSLFDRICPHPTSTAPHVHYPVPGIAHTLKIIHEPTLMTRLQQARQTMTERGIAFTERIMFHGTTPDARTSICQQGFKHGYSRVPGIWVAESAYAWNHQQSGYPTQPRQLLACRVLIPSVLCPSQRFFDSDEQPFAHIQTGPITVVTHTHCVVPCAIIHF